MKAKIATGQLLLAELLTTLESLVMYSVDKSISDQALARLRILCEKIGEPEPIVKNWKAQHYPTFFKTEIEKL